MSKEISPNDVENHKMVVDGGLEKFVVCTEISSTCSGNKNLKYLVEEFQKLVPANNKKSPIVAPHHIPSHFLLLDNVDRRGTIHSSRRKKWVIIPMTLKSRADKNIRLGSGYLKQMLDQNNGHQILATASYNAGPHRVKKWMPRDNDMPADLWVEIIPFKETRRYVKNAMAHTTIFDKRLDGQHIPLTKRMPLIP